MPLSFSSTNYVVVASDVSGSNATGGINLIAVTNTTSSFSAYKRAADVDARWNGWNVNGAIPTKWLAVGF